MCWFSSNLGHGGSPRRRRSFPALCGDGALLDKAVSVLVSDGALLDGTVSVLDGDEAVSRW
ncbi:hypothetical protein F2Q70_00016162 [Brassica cretica]|uniref:Uncharacterized protein n=1 Tax=Brassica cretica TaxID=69181 RepID=A0A8S9HUV5_BRACR|nr:hypothetical protein F2Q70_00016162 [Brassica cretica]